MTADDAVGGSVSPIVGEAVGDAVGEAVVGASVGDSLGITQHSLGSLHELSSIRSPSCPLR